MQPVASDITGPASGEVPATQHAIQFVGADEIRLNPAKTVDRVGPTHLLLQV